MQVLELKHKYLQFIEKKRVADIQSRQQLIENAKKNQLMISGLIKTARNTNSKNNSPGEKLKLNLPPFTKLSKNQSQIGPVTNFTTNPSLNVTANLAVNSSTANGAANNNYFSVEVIGESDTGRSKNIHNNVSRVLSSNQFGGSGSLLPEAIQSLKSQSKLIIPKSLEKSQSVFTKNKNGLISQAKDGYKTNEDYFRGTFNQSQFDATQSSGFNLSVKKAKSNFLSKVGSKFSSN